MKILIPPSEGKAKIQKPQNTLFQVMERYWRWYAGKEEKLSLAAYWHDFKGSIRPMAASDLANGDWGCACISLLSPHYRFWKTLYNKLRAKGSSASLKND